MRLLPWEYGVRNLGRSPLRLVLLAGGAMVVVLLMLTAGAFVRGLEGMLEASGGEQNLMLIGSGSQESIERSEISLGAASQITAGVPGIRERLGTPYVSPEIYVQLVVRTARDASTGRPLVVRGVTDRALLVHREVRITAGRFPHPGRNEILVGQLVPTRMGLDAGRLRPGQTLWIDDREWTISGTFEAPGSVLGSEVWTDLSDLQVATKREGLSAVTITVHDSGSLEEAQLFCFQRTDLELIVLPEQDYYAALNRFYRPIRFLVWATAGLIVIGGLLGGLNTMYAAFASRIRELATLQALGYRRGAILASLVQESLLAAAAGTLPAIALGLLLLDGLAVRFSMTAFHLTIDEKVLGVALVTGASLGLIGAILPAWRCLRPAIPHALRAA